MKISQLMSKAIYTCRPSDTLHGAAQLMWDHDCGAIPVVDDAGKIIAMVTDRDACMAAYIQSRPLHDIPVSLAMSREVYSCGVEDTVEHAEALMKEHQVRRIPIIDAERRPVGIVSLNDIAREAAQERGRRNPAVDLGKVASTLAGICAPRPAPSSHLGA